jgi:hypothetical protein
MCIPTGTLPEISTIFPLGLRPCWIARNSSAMRSSWVDSAVTMRATCRKAVVSANSLNRNMLVCVFRRLGGRRWIQRQFDRLRTHDGWIFPAGSSGPFGDELRGRWLSHEELCATAREFLRLRQEDPRTLLWASAGLGSNPFWADLHARSD